LKKEAFSMAQSFTDIAALQQYLSGVVVRAGHHAPNITEVIGPLTVAVILKHDSGSLEYREYAGNPTNILRFKILGRAYSLAYNHQHGGRIEAREDSDTGPVRQWFTNADALAAVLSKFDQL
jgi:hypothetical protein